MRIFGQLFGHSVLVIKWCVVLQRGKCGCFVLIIKWFFEVKPPYGQSDFMVNPGPTILLCLYAVPSRSKILRGTGPFDVFFPMPFPNSVFEFGFFYMVFSDIVFCCPPTCHYIQPTWLVSLTGIGRRRRTGRGLIFFISRNFYDILLQLQLENVSDTYLPIYSKRLKNALTGVGWLWSIL